MTHWYVPHDSCICATWLVDMCDITHWCEARFILLQCVAVCCSVLQCVIDVGHDSFIDVRHDSQFIHMRYDSFCCSVLKCVADVSLMGDTIHSVAVCWSVLQCVIDVGHDSFIDVRHDSQCIHIRYGSFIWGLTYSYETWLIRMCDLTHSYVRHDSFIRATWLIHTCDMTHSYVPHDVCDMTHSYVRHDSFIWDMTHSYETWFIHIRRDSFIWDMTHSDETWFKLTFSLRKSPTHCSTLQHTATHCSTLQHTATHCNTLRIHCNTLCVYCNTFCNTLDLQ